MCICVLIFGSDIQAHGDTGALQAPPLTQAPCGRTPQPSREGASHPFPAMPSTGRPRVPMSMHLEGEVLFKRLVWFAGAQRASIDEDTICFDFQILASRN